MRTVRPHLVALASILAVISLVAPSGPAPRVARAATSDPAGAALMRLTNLDREALGKQALAIDPFLVSLARDYRFTCPSDHSLVIAGRARDMADRSYFSHDIPGCGETILDVVKVEFSYNTKRAENIAWNDYPAGTSSYRIGCDIGGGNCAGGTTSTMTSVVIAERQFMQSAGHRTNILGDYDRFGCGSATTDSGGTYFSCIFSKGGPTTVTLQPVAPNPAAVDRTPPKFVLLSGVARVMSSGHGLRESARVSDDVKLGTLVLKVDGHVVARWTLSGRTTTRAVWLSPGQLSAGAHRMQWVLRDAAGNARTTGWVLTVR